MGTRLQGKVAVVCGAGASAGGLSNGMATSIVFAREGARVFAVDRDVALAEATRERIAAEGGECVLHQCDVSDAAQVARMAEACTERFGRIDVLFNNVGVFALGGPLELSEEEFDRLMRVNVKAMFLTCRAVIPVMLRQGAGAIVNNASVSAIRYSVPSLAYSMSKAAVLQLTQNIGLQYAARGIRCNAVLPGNILTDRLVARLRATHGEAYVDKVREWAEQVPCGRTGEPWDVAYAVLFLASDEARYVNAVELIVDGGLSASYVGRVSP
jgi:NAD(P)-dependent dehydrogenase (short-subunit alcohol dehydrogenase family)